MRWLIHCLGLVLVLLASTLPAQLEVAVQRHFPRHPAKDSWYCNPDSAGKVWHYDGSRWNRLLAGDDRPPFLHQGLVWIPKGEHHALCTTSGKLIIADADMVTNNGKVFVGLADFRHLFAINVAGDTLSFFQIIRYTERHGIVGGDPMWYHQNLEGKTYDVLTAYVPGTRSYRPKDLHAWGMLDAEGTWVIPPVFDAPFRFEEGRAATVYYGQPRVINLKGEFVE